MLTTSTRLLRLLSLLQAPGVHTGAELAERLEVSPRSLRTDIAALRELGYVVESSPGVGGGYSLGSGTALPPLLLDDADAIAMAVGLRLASAGAVEGIEESSVVALAKLLAILPSALRHRVEDLTAAMAVAGGPSSRAEPTAVPSPVLEEIADCIRRGLGVRFEYRGERRRVEPAQLVARAGRWYLVGWDASRVSAGAPESAGWRVFRVDRMQLRAPHGPRFRPRAFPADFAAYVDAAIEQTTWAFRAQVRLFTPADVIAARAPESVHIEPEGDASCIVTVGSDDPAALAEYLALWNADFEVLDSPELLEQVEVVAGRYARAVAAGT